MLKQYVPQRLWDRSWLSSRIRYALRPSLLLAFWLLAGCAGGIEIRPAGAQDGPPPATLVQCDQALAVLGVDYDPPLAGTSWVAGTLGEGVTLLVAVANQGRVTAEDVQVVVALLDPGAPPDAPELATEMQVIKVLPPGQVAQLRFAAISSLPERAQYVLRVEARPLPGETEVTDNVRSYDIRLQVDPQDAE